jgi:thiol-disulfide isomerase/thioredoxin
MRSIIIGLLGLVLICACGPGNKEAKAATESTVKLIQPEKKAPIFEDLEGQPVSLADYKGKKVLLNFWATWCRPCLEEMPSLLKAQDILEKEDYVFLLASEQSIKIINDFKAKKDYDFTFLKLNGTLAAQQINALPTTFVYNTAGEKVETILGGVVWDSDAMIEKLKSIQ